MRHLAVAALLCLLFAFPVSSTPIDLTTGSSSGNVVVDAVAGTVTFTGDGIFSIDNYLLTEDNYIFTRSYIFIGDTRDNVLSYHLNGRGMGVEQPTTSHTITTSLKFPGYGFGDVISFEYVLEGSTAATSLVLYDFDARGFDYNAPGYVPEPASIALFASGIIAAVLRRKKIFKSQNISPPIAR